MKNIYELDLHESTTVNENINIIRVPGHWIYTLPNKEPIAIPFNYEFMFANMKVELNPRKIIELVREYFNLPKNFIKSRSREGEIPLAKKIISKILIDYTRLTTSKISKILNYKTHSTVVIGLQTLSDLMETEEKIRTQYNYLLSRIKSDM